MVKLDKPFNKAAVSKKNQHEIRVAIRAYIG